MRKKYKVTIEADGEIIFIANIKRGKSEREINLKGQSKIWMKLKLYCIMLKKH